MSKTYIGIDNGSTGAIGIISPVEEVWYPMPVRIEQNYTKTKKNISRVSWADLTSLITKHCAYGRLLAVIERPMVNPGRFQATMSAVRALEATLITLESLNIPHEYIDSKEWQKTQLPSGLRKEELKRGSLDVGRRLWPSIRFPKGADADALLIARHAKLKNL